MKLAALLTPVVAVVATAWLGAEGFYAIHGKCPLEAICPEAQSDAEACASMGDAPPVLAISTAPTPLRHGGCCSSDATPVAALPGACPVTPDCLPGDPCCTTPVADHSVSATPVANHPVAPTPTAPTGDACCPVAPAAATGLDTPAGNAAVVAAMPTEDLGCGDCGGCCGDEASAAPVNTQTQTPR